jgi:hypothetical protein
MTFKQCGDYIIPILAENEPLTDAHVALLATAIQSDGCTAVSELFHECCVVHDLGYEFGIDPWGRQVTKRAIDAAFRRSMQKRSKLGVLSPVAAVRWLGVRLFGRKFRKLRWVETA